MKLSEKFKLLLRLPFTWIQRICYPTPKIMSDMQTLKYIYENKCSIARFGDGELDLMYNIGIKFQKADRKLSKRLREIACYKDYSKALICIPDIFLSKKQLHDKFAADDAKWYCKNLLATRGLWHKSFRNSFYGDANLSRFYVERNDKNRVPAYVNELKKLWEGRDIVFVEGEKSRLGMGNDLFDNAKSIKRILCPSRNAFDKYDAILSTVLSYTTNEDLIICALGPTATVLSYDLSQNDRTALDLGHVDIEYEWFLLGTTRKEGIKGKDVNEVNDAFNEDCAKVPTNVIAEIY